MNNIEAYHTLARTYCIKKITKLEAAYSIYANKALEIYNITGNINSKALVDFAKDNYNSYDNIKIQILKIMLDEIESILPNKLLTIYQMKEALEFAVHKASIHYANCFADTEPNGIIKVCNYEKQRFYNYINKIRFKNLTLVEKLPYRHVLSYEEAAIVSESFYSSWNKKISKLWDNKISSPPHSCKDIQPISSNNFINTVDSKVVGCILKKRGINKIWALSHGRLPAICYIMDICYLDIKEFSGDTCWCSDNFNWGIKRDHEGFIYICSQWLIKEIRNIYPQLFNKHIEK